MIKVVKLGGNVIDTPLARAEALRSIASLESPTIVVHGGGKVATELSDSLEIHTTMIEGRRVTDAESLRTVTMVYAGLINKTLVAELQALGSNALGLCGADADIIRAHKRENATIDFGFVGDIDHVRADLLRSFLNQGFVPVVAPLTHDGLGQLLNTNADTLASSIATAVRSFDEVELILCFDKPGVLRRIDDHKSVMPTLNRQEYEDLRRDGVISHGMIAKCDNAFAAAERDIHVRLCPYNDFTAGTLVVGEHSS